MSIFPKKKLMILKIFIILIQISQIQNSQFSIRNLLDSPSVQKVCDRSSKEVKEFFEMGDIHYKIKNMKIMKNIFKN